MIDITVVIPSYERAHLVGRAIESVLAQTLAPTRVVVVDDGSTDATAEVVARFGDAVEYHYQANAGGAAARNRGVEVATTEWVAFLDSDDLWLPEHLAGLAAAVEATDGAADLYFSDVARTAAEGGGSTFDLARLSFDGPHLLRPNPIGWAVADHQPAMLQGLLVRREAFEAVGGLWPELSSRHDTHFFYFAFAQRPACAVAGATVQMTSDEDDDRRLTSGTGVRGRRYWECTVRLYTEVLNRRTDANERRLAGNLLARGHKRLAVAQWAEGDRRGALHSWWSAVRSSPTGLLYSMLPGNRRPPAVLRARRALTA